MFATQLSLGKVEYTCARLIRVMLVKFGKFWMLESISIHICSICPEMAVARVLGLLMYQCCLSCMHLNSIKNCTVKSTDRFAYYKGQYNVTL